MMMMMMSRWGNNNALGEAVDSGADNKNTAEVLGYRGIFGMFFVDLYVCFSKTANDCNSC